MSCKHHMTGFLNGESELGNVEMLVFSVRTASYLSLLC